MQGNGEFDFWELFPYSLQTLAEWADVYQDRERKDKSRDRILIYKNLSDAKPGTVYPVAIRLQGFLRQFRVDRFGNWSGKEPILSEAQDPARKYLPVQEHWNVMDPLTTAELTEAGKILPIDSIILTEGDFVDVGAELDFVVSRERNKETTLKCFLTCTHVVRLIAAHNIEHLDLVRTQCIQCDSMLIIYTRKTRSLIENMLQPPLYRKERSRKLIRPSFSTANNLHI
ncbi:hypothetical protein DEU56DRAFT_739127 [Suillus clintonianus]|uniref:uncharacterized protein n=1 Tax=Suillus clintonianus TaxID=1904413 RepID=UPI001B85EB29|nr:uncharacterized protein DEU56DRAFT_739127 [Suillus clintonianus]KAG2133024.1 hypothetical protein DEU56DRAFT_739127 [Suillus clintonianus]